MARDTDESKASTLPDPELNPLLNPLLAAHMGRWAEVYFTSPPEKRGQAIAELLRELEKNSTSESVSAPPAHDENIPARVEKHSEELPLLSSLAAADEPAPICGSCGHTNSALQRFCGMCGKPLTNSPEGYASQVAEAEPIAAVSWCESESPLEGGRDWREKEYEVESTADSDFAVEDHPLRSLREQSPEDFGILSEYRAGSVPRSYRIYAGVVLAILLTLVAYMAWRGNAAFWNSRTAPLAPPQAVPRQQTESPAATSAPEQRRPAMNAMPADAPASPSPQTRNSTATRSQEDETTEAGPAPQTLPVNSRSSTLGLDPIGSAELATAEKYLNGSPGMARDSQQAATWLWKAVAKQNLAATMLLSDLYLRGDGVPKSCDQARLLLDAAARKGGAAAAERLRHLAAFGCQ
ncbi:MAG: hypothetical protein WCA49_15665 [Candidatus Sulfotelmatobacter sp.]